MKQYFNPRSHERSDANAARSSLDFTISIHAPTRGATVSAVKEECAKRISIHAPTRGATCYLCLMISVMIFQSTLPREERLKELYPEIKRIGFQSTLPREERLEARERAEHGRDFNPRSHERSDIRVSSSASCTSISIHAPTRGATLILLFYHMECVFQSTLPREERQQYCTKNLFIFIQYRQ